MAQQIKERDENPRFQHVLGLSCGKSVRGNPNFSKLQ